MPCLTNTFELFDGRQLRVACSGQHVLDRTREKENCMDNTIGWREQFMREICVDKIHSVRYAHRLCESIDYQESMIVHKVIVDVETVSSLLIPQILHGRGVMDDHFANKSSQWSCLKIKWSNEIFPRGDLWVERVLPQEVEHKLHLYQELVPQIFWKIRVDDREKRLKVCF